MHTEGNDPGRPEGTSPRPSPKRDGENPGYETQDVNVGGIITFVAGLSGFILIFFVVCFFMGRLINWGFDKQDGEANKWHSPNATLGATPRGQKREDLTSNFEMEQRQLAQVSRAFPTPVLQTDDGNQDTADMHAKEDLLLNFYSSSADQPGGTVRIPIARAMELVVQRGLPKPAATVAPRTLMAGETAPKVQMPLTDGFARTGYELDTMEARAQKLEFAHAEGRR